LVFVVLTTIGWLSDEVVVTVMYLLVKQHEDLVQVHLLLHQ